MTTKALEELDGGGLGSCQAGEDLSALTDPCPGQPQEGRTQGMFGGTGRTKPTAPSTCWTRQLTFRDQDLDPHIGPA